MQRAQRRKIACRKGPGARSPAARRAGPPQGERAVDKRRKFVRIDRLRLLAFRSHPEHHPPSRVHPGLVEHEFPECLLVGRAPPAGNAPDRQGGSRERRRREGERGRGGYPRDAERQRLLDGLPVRAFFVQTRRELVHLLFALVGNRPHELLEFAIIFWGSPLCRLENCSSFPCPRSRAAGSAGPSSRRSHRRTGRRQPSPRSGSRSAE